MSAATVLRVLPQMRGDQEGAVRALLAAALGTSRLWFRDPVRAVLGLPATMVASVLDRTLAVPGAEEDAALDPEAALIAAHRRLAHPDEAKRQGPTLALAALTCEARLGAAWYYAPARWATRDGFAPMASVWTAYAGLMALDAQHQLAFANAIRLGNSTDPKTDKAFKTLAKMGYPPDPTMRAA